MATSQDNCVCSQRQAGVEEEVGGGGGRRRRRWEEEEVGDVFGLPDSAVSQRRSAVMVFVLAWLPLALDADLYYPAGSRFIMSVLLSSANFLFLFFFFFPLPLAYYQRLPERVQGLNRCDDATFLKWAETPVRHISLGRKKYWLIVAGLGGGKWIENVLLCVCVSVFIFLFFL